MDRSRNEFLARAGLAINEHGGVRRRHHLDLIQHGSQCGACTHDVFEVMLRNVFPLLPRSLVPGDTLLDRIQQILIRVVEADGGPGQATLTIFRRSAL